MNTIPQTILAYILYFVVKILYVTYRFKFDFIEHRREAENFHLLRSFIVAIWHENLFAGILSHAGQPFCPMTSPSLDGDFAVFVMKRFGFKPIRGSSSRRGKEASEEIIEALEKGQLSAITVDGPKGPRRIVKSGIFNIASRSKTAIIPVAVVADRKWILNKSWDKFKIPKPFARILVRYGTPIYVKENLDKDDLTVLKSKLAQILDSEEDKAYHSLEKQKNKKGR